MNQYVTGAIIRQLREQKGLTQESLASQLHVSSKAVSKWETGQGLPDISLLEPLAKALDISMIELFAGRNIVNKNRSSNLLRSVCYVCPVCGNILYAAGDAVISCCGITLPALEPEETDESHRIRIQSVEDEHFITVAHDMTKSHYISFVAFVTTDRIQLIKFYPEGNAETRLQLRGSGFLYVYCNQHGLMRQKL